MAQNADTLIIGGGVIGLTTAYMLAKQGQRVDVVDKGELGMEASWAGAGIIPPGTPELAATAYDRLRAESSQMFPALTRELHELTGIDNGYRVCGGIEYLADEVEETVAAWRREGVPFELLQPGGYSSNHAAYLLPGMAQVRNPWHLRALVEACGRLGATLRTGNAVMRIDHAGNRVTGVRLADGTRCTADRYLIAAGAWSDRLLLRLGLGAGIHPVLGQIVLLKSETPPKRILLSGKNYLVPREDGHVLIGSTEEPEAGFNKQNTPEAVDGLLEFGITLVPALAGAEIVKTWAGLRPGSLDGLPSLGRAGDFQNLFLAAGHFRAGIQLSPATGLVLSELLLDKSPSLPLDDFRPGREPGAPLRPIFHS
jgi:glycine oxidase